MKTKRHEVTSEVEEDEEIKKECEKYMGMSFCIPFHKKCHLKTQIAIGPQTSNQKYLKVFDMATSST